MKIFAVIVGLLALAFGGSCLYLSEDWGGWPTAFLGWIPMITGFGLTMFAVDARARGGNADDRQGCRVAGAGSRLGRRRLHLVSVVEHQTDVKWTSGKESEEEWRTKDNACVAV